MIDVQTDSIKHLPKPRDMNTLNISVFNSKHHTGFAIPTPVSPIVRTIYYYKTYFRVQLCKSDPTI